MTRTTTALNDLIGESAPMRELRATVVTIAPTRLPVLIYGQTGSGKELVAAALHSESGRGGAFIPFNVCALGDSMFEDALFGHVRGAYTGALRDAPGFLREADRGTAFFDEISGLAVGLQAKLLRAIELGVFRPIGATRDVRSDFRVVAATNEAVGDLVSNGRFRADLAHRLCGVTIHVPRLADRREDIPLLVDHFLDGLVGPEIRQVEPKALQRLQGEAWPGNVRELRQVVETAAAFSSGVLDERCVEHALRHRARTREDAPATYPGERTDLMRLLDRCAWDADQVAEILGVHRATVYRRMKRLGLSQFGSTQVAFAHPTRRLELA